MRQILANPTGLAVLNTDPNLTDKDNVEELPIFRIYTKAVCDNLSDSIFCHDELFAKCGDLEYMLPRDQVNGKGIFNRDWEDPRSR